MPLSHFLLAFTVIFIWGTNFVVIKWGLADFHPFWFATLRFVFSFLPWIFFLKRPKASWSSLIMVGCLMGVGQFGLLYFAMQSYISAGMASLLVQAQIFFTLLLSIFLFKEFPTKLQTLAIMISLIGYVIVISVSIAHPQTVMTLTGITLVFGAAFAWSCSNLVIRKVGKVNMLNFLVWSSPFATVPLVLLSILFEGTDSIISSTQQASLSAWGAVLWQAIANTLFGFGIWNFLLTRHSSASFTPLALLIPIFGILSATWLLNEPLPFWQIIGAIIVMLGLSMNVLSSLKRTT